VLAAFDLASRSAKAGQRASDSQELVCELFERHGYPTLRQNAAATVGYVHGLGHGVGLEVHEKPSFALADSNHDRIEVGDVLTIEPGLYFPDEVIGVRIEETFYVDESGELVTFCASERGLEP
jgi:Xaa-Pro aminopeptidase